MTKGFVQSVERERLESQLSTLMREKKRLKGKLSRAVRAAPATGQDSLLREQMHELAAEVVALTARLEGPDSPIAGVLAKADEVHASENGERSSLISLADRVRALQKATLAEYFFGSARASSSRR